jgi:single-strand DNA-binding protein
MATRSVNKVLLIGNLGRDAETKFTPSGAAVTRFSVATSRRWKDQASGEWKEEANWTNVTLWRAENLANYLTKGKQVYVEGRIQTRSYDDKDGKKVYTTEVVADEVILLGGRGESDASSNSEGGGYQAARSSGAGNRPRAAASAPAASAPDDDFGSGMTISDDDIPF